MIAVAGGLLLVLNPLGIDLRERLFPTEAAVSGRVLVGGRAAAGARLTLDDKDGGTTADDGSFLISNVRRGTHRLQVQLLGARPKTKMFPIGEGDTELALPDISLTPQFALGYVVTAGTPRRSGTELGAFYDLYLWADAPARTLRRVKVVAYALPRPLSDPTVRRRDPASSFCYHERGKLPLLRIPRFGPTSAVVELGSGRRITIRAVRPQPHGRHPSCPVTGSTKLASPPRTSRPRATPPTPPTAQTSTSNPAANVIVPNVLDTPVEAAVPALQSLNLVPRVTRIASEMPFGRVATQRPSAGARVVPNSIVEISISNGSRLR